MFKRNKTSVSVTLASLMLAGAAQAQIDEIIVTANKREQTLQEVPISVSVTSGETIQQSSIVDLIDLQTAVPSLRVNQLQSSAQTNFVIRGFGNGANNPGIEPAVLVLIDGVPRSRSSSSLADLPTVERVEVLSGPQSTLFGKNASAGVISITTKAPEDEFSGLVEATVGNYGANIVKGTLTGPLTDSLSYRLSASSNQMDGFATNLSDGSGVNTRDREAFRAQLLWEPSDNLSVRFTADMDEMDEVCCTAGQLRKGDAGLVADSIALGALALGDTTRGVTNANPWERESYMNFEPYNRVENEGLSLHVEYDLGFATLTSITADRETTLRSNFDADFSAAKLINENLVNYDFQTFTQEFRLSSNGDSDMQWTVGAFFADEDTTTMRTVTYGDEIYPFVDFLLSGVGSSLLGVAELVSQLTLVGAYQQGGMSEADAQVAVGTLLATSGQAGVDGALSALQAGGAEVLTSTQMDALFFVPNSGSTGENFHMESETLSLFANVDLPLTDRLLATIGLNYTDDKKTVVADVTVDDLFSSLPLPAALAGVQFFPPFVNYPNADENGIWESSDTTHTLRLTYDVNDSTKAYVSHSTGFKPTSVNLSVNANNATIGRAADPEKSENIELGLKHSHDAGYINVAFFKQNIEGFQSNTFTGNGFSLVNAGDQQHQGVEIDSITALSENLVVGLSAVKIDAEYKSFVNGSCDTIGLDDSYANLACDEGKQTRDLTGEIPAGVHDWSINANATYSFNMNDATSGFLRLEYVYENDVPLVDNVPVTLASRGSKNVNLSLGFNHEPSGLELMLWGRNLTDYESLISAFPTTAQPGSFSGYPNPPRTYGLTLRGNF
jgi:iron complex outermembrane receptor protein